MKVYTQVGNTPYVLGSEELWTANLDNGADFSAKEASDIIADFIALDIRGGVEEGDSKYWCS